MSPKLLNIPSKVCLQFTVNYRYPLPAKPASLV